MKKRILTYASMLLAVLGFVACSDSAEDVNEFSDANVQLKNFSITAKLPTANTFGAVKTFSLSDLLHVTFQKADGTQTGRTQTLRCSQAEGTTATFTAQRVAVPTDAANMMLTWDNPSCKINWEGKPVEVAGFAEQGGTEEWVRQHSVISATTAVSETADVTLAYQTAVLKINLNFPADADAPTTENTKVTLSGVVNKLVLDNGKAVTTGDGVVSTTGDIVITPATVSGQTATAYAVIWPQASYSDVTLSAAIDNAKFSGVFRVNSVQPGTENSVATTVDFNSREYDLWFNDDAATIEDVTGNVVSTAKWMSLSNGVISIEANTTGSIRKGTMELDNGRKYTVTQIGVNDFSGSWTFYSKQFNASKSWGGSNNTSQKPVTFGAPLKGETLTGPDGKTYTNNFGIKGLYFDSVLDGTIAIDYEAKTVKVGIMFDCREGQATGNDKYKYCMYLPEGAASNTWANYNFQPKDFSTTNYDWLWLTLGADNKTLSYQFYLAGQKIGNYYVCGISIVTSSSAEASSFTSSYENIYQANYNTNNAAGMYFLKN